MKLSQAVGSVASFLILSIISSELADAREGGCYRLIPSGFVCGERETSTQNTECANCPGMPTCAQCGGPSWEIYPFIISLCDNAVGTGCSTCEDNGVFVYAKKHFYMCDANDCYVYSHMINVGNGCSSAILGGDPCTP